MDKIEIFLSKIVGLDPFLLCFLQENEAQENRETMLGLRTCFRSEYVGKWL